MLLEVDGLQGGPVRAPDLADPAAQARLLVDDLAELVEGDRAGVDATVALGGERRADVAALPLAQLVASRVEQRQLLFHQVVADDGGELLEGVVEGLGVGALELQQRQ